MWVLYDQQVQHLLDNFTPPPHFTPRVPKSKKIHANISTLLKQYPTHGSGFCQETHTARVKRITGVRAHTPARTCSRVLILQFQFDSKHFFPPKRWKDYSHNKAIKALYCRARLKDNGECVKRTLNRISPSALPVLAVVKIIQTD